MRTCTQTTLSRALRLPSASQTYAITVPEFLVPALRGNSSRRTIATSGRKNTQPTPLKLSPDHRPRLTRRPLRPAISLPSAKSRRDPDGWIKTVEPALLSGTEAQDASSRVEQLVDISPESL